MAVMLDEPCAVFGDYDVDGGASAALLARYFKVLDGSCGSTSRIA